MFNTAWKIEAHEQDKSSRADVNEIDPSTPSHREYSSGYEGFVWGDNTLGGALLHAGRVTCTHSPRRGTCGPANAAGSSLQFVLQKNDYDRHPNC
jgi:hypothetical protein